MSTNFPDRRRKRSRSAKRRFGAKILFTTFVLLAVFTTYLAVRPSRRTVRGMEAAVAKLMPLSVQEFATKFPKQFVRLVYPYSIVPGGVDSAEDVQRAALADPVVREHYKGLEMEKLHPVDLAEARLAYVSYRKGDEVYWTTKKIRLFKGERVLTDGAKLVRARCGNLISDTPVAIASKTEPTGDTLNTPTSMAVSPTQYDNGDGLGPDPVLVAQNLPGSPAEIVGPVPEPAPAPATPETSTPTQGTPFIPAIGTFPGGAVPANPSGPGTVIPPVNPGSPSTTPTEPVKPDDPVTPPVKIPTVMPPREIPGTPPEIPNFPHRPGEPPTTPPGPNPPVTLTDPVIPPIPPVDPPVPPTPIPEPSTWLLVGISASALVLELRRRRRSQSRP